MAKYLLSVHSGGGEAGPPMTQKDMQQFMERVNVLEVEMRSKGVLVFGGALNGPDTAKVVHASKGKVIKTDGPFAETKEQLGGFYIIEADDQESALDWAGKVTACVMKPIEVRPFRAGSTTSDS